jgi:glycosyltransferase involved in cell wall biosynthesis
MPGATLCINGSGPDRVRLERLIVERGCTEQVRLVGELSSSELSIWYRAADLCILNSGYEGLSHTLLEAMAHGTPCAASDVGGNPEVVHAGESGFLFTYDDATGIVNSILEALTAPEKAKRMAQNALVWVQGRTHEHMLQETIRAVTK